MGDVRRQSDVCCACRIVIYAPKPAEGGKFMRDAWRCQMCRAEFVRATACKECRGPVSKQEIEANAGYCKTCEENVPIEFDGDGA